MRRAVRQGSAGGRSGARPAAPVRQAAEAAAAKPRGLGGAAAHAAHAAAAAAAAAGLLLGGGPAAAELNRLEYERGGEFNRGTAMQFGGTDMIKVDIAKQYGNDLRLSNFVQVSGCVQRGAFGGQG